MLRQIVIEAETPGDSRTMFRLRIDTSVIAEDLTTVQAHLLVGEILERIALPKPKRSNDAERRSINSAALPLGGRWRDIKQLSQDKVRAVFKTFPVAGLAGAIRDIRAGPRSDGMVSLIRSFAFPLAQWSRRVHSGRPPGA